MFIAAAIYNRQDMETPDEREYTAEQKGVPQNLAPRAGQPPHTLRGRRVRRAVCRSWGRCLRAGPLETPARGCPKPVSF